MRLLSRLTPEPWKVMDIMNIKKIAILLFLLLLLPFAIKVHGQDYGRNVSLFTDVKAHKVGDILTVLIYEQASASNQVQTKTEKTSQHGAEIGPGEGEASFIPLFKFNSDSKNSFDGKGQNSRNGSLRAKMSVTVVEVRDNGDLVIEGSRTIGISGDKESMNLTGVVRQRDIEPDNSIPSYLIADAQISYTGKGTANTGSRPGIITRVLNWIF